MKKFFLFLVCVLFLSGCSYSDYTMFDNSFVFIIIGFFIVLLIVFLFYFIFRKKKGNVVDFSSKSSPGLDNFIISGEGSNISKFSEQDFNRQLMKKLNGEPYAEQSNTLRQDVSGDIPDDYSLSSSMDSGLSGTHFIPNSSSDVNTFQRQNDVTSFNIFEQQSFISVPSAADFDSSSSEDLNSNIVNSMDESVVSDDDILDDEIVDI